jgi:light-regulated signal transduction histidine kinase (bacteriophytochrome)
MELGLTSVALADVCADAERAFRPHADEKGLSFAIELDPVLPASIVSDQHRLGQVLKNLLANAFKFTREGGVRPSVGYPVQDRAGLRSDLPSGAERVIAFTVTDTGVGIPEDKLTAIFEAFQQADGSNVAQVRRDRAWPVDLTRDRPPARGRDPVESVLGLGSRFSLLVPAAPQAAWRTHDPAPAAAAGEDGAVAGEAAVTDDADRIGPKDRVLLVVDSDTERLVPR